MKCPICELENPPSSSRCDCGYDFDSRTIETALFSYENNNQEIPADRKNRVAHLIFLVDAVVISVLMAALAIEPEETLLILFLAGFAYPLVIVFVSSVIVASILSFLCKDVRLKFLCVLSALYTCALLFAFKERASLTYSSESMFVTCSVCYSFICIAISVSALLPHTGAGKKIRRA